MILDSSRRSQVEQADPCTKTPSECIIGHKDIGNEYMSLA